MRTALTAAPIDVAALLREAAAPGVGGLVLFAGTVREVNDGRSVTGIDYSAYPAMAERELAAIAAEAAARHPGLDVVVEHRLGTLAVGEISVAIVTAHAHRAAAYEGNRFVIEELKRRVPIWKREHYTDGERGWVDPTGAPAPVVGRGAE